jgi:hypothetical protein
MLHIDGRIWRSVWLLLAKPGRITAEYCAGRKARFITPLRLCLIFSIISVATSTLGNSSVDKEPNPRRTTRVSIPLNSGKPKADKGEATRDDVIRVGNLTVDKRITGKLSEQEVKARVRHAYHDWLPRLSLFLTPVWALLAMLVTRKARRGATHNYPEYLYFSLHANAAFAAAFAVDHLMDLMPWAVAHLVGDILSYAYIICYTAIGLRVLFGGGWTRNLLRTLAIGTLYGIIYGIGFIAVMATAVLI